MIILFENTVTLMDGTYEHCLGVFSSKDKALDYLNTRLWFDESTKLNEDEYVFHYDGELSTHWKMQKIELDKPLYE